MIDSEKKGWEGNGVIAIEEGSGRTEVIDFEEERYLG